jgi:hypothetical protein
MESEQRSVVDELGKHFWWKTAGLVVGVGLLCLLSLLIINGLYYRFGAIGALVIIFGIALALVFRSDRKKAREYYES